MLTRGRMASKCEFTLAISRQRCHKIFIFSPEVRRLALNYSRVRKKCAVSANTLFSIFFLFRASKRVDPLERRAGYRFAEYSGLIWTFLDLKKLLGTLCLHNKKNPNDQTITFNV